MRRPLDPPPPRAALIAEITERIRRGDGVGLIGPAGIGKSALLERVGATAVRHQVLSVRGRRSSIDVPLGAFEAVLAPGIDQVRSAIAALRDQWTGAGRDTLLIVDDADLLDPASSFVAHALATTSGVTTLLGHRAESVLPPAVGQIWRDAALAEVVVPALSAPELAALAEEWLGDPLGPATVDRLVGVVGGNPLLLRELLEAGRRTAALERVGGTWHWNGTWSVGPRLAGIVDERLASLDVAQRRLVEHIALAEPVGLDAVLEVAGASLDDAEALEQAQLVRVDDRGEVGLAHPVFGEVVRSRMSASRRRKLAGSLAQLPIDRPSRRPRAIRWRLDAGLPVTADELLAAAQVALRSEHLDDGIDLARRAIEAGAAARGGHVLGIMLDEAGRVDEATAALEAAWSSDDTDVDGMVLVGLVRAEHAFDHAADPAQAWALLDEVEERYPSAASAAAAMRVIERQLVGRPLDALALAERYLAHPVVDPDADPGQHAERLARVGLPVVLARAVIGRADDAVSFAEAALTAREAVRDGAGVGYARDAVFAVALSFAYEAAGRLDDALALAQLGHRMSLDQGELQGQAWFSLVIGDVMQARGEPELAESWFGEAASAFGQARRPAARWAWAGAATAASSSGDIERALAHLGRIDAAGPSGWRFLDPLIDRARAWVASLAGDDAGALGHLDRGVRTSRDAGMAWLEAFLLIDVVCFDPVLGASTTGRLDELAEVVCDPRVGIWARAASALVGRDVSAIETGADELGRLGLRLDAGDLLAIAATRSWPTDVAVATRLATAARRASGAPGLVTPASRRLATVPGLSPRVLQVADLAAGGASSREIAERLTIGVRTVDNQLGRVFRTFGVSSRHELSSFIDAWYGPVDGRPHRH